jgi:hypothetical protein
VPVVDDGAPQLGQISRKIIISIVSKHSFFIC